MRRVVEGETELYELIMRRHNQRLYRLARSVVRNDHDAEEALQEAYLRAFTRFETFAGRSSFITWLSRIVLNEAKRLAQRESTERRARSRAVTDRRTGDVGHEASGAPPVSQQEIARAMDALPEKLRMVAMLRLVQELGTRETATSLGITEASVRISLHRARRKLVGQLRTDPALVLSESFSFDGERCDRIVWAVFAKLALPS